MSFSSKVITGVPLTRENFTAPPREMGILPFWFWNGELDEKEMEWQMREYKDRGISGFFIHGRFGLKVPYVSDQWFEKVKFVVAKAKEIGIDAWVYDEMNWPSGTAERRVPKNHPHLTQRYLELVALNVDGPLFTFLEATDDRYVNTGNAHPIAAFGCTEEEYQNGIKNLIDLTPNLSFDKVIPWEAPPGKWRLLYFLEKEVPYYIDALDPESTERFIEITHDRYKQAVGNEFGKTVPGFFTDEPAMHYYHVGIDNFVVPWTKHMFKVFRERRGYDLRPYLPALYVSMGEKTAQIRYDFWRTLTEQYSDSYYKRLREWCDENGVIFTGHLLFEEWLRMHARCEGNIFKHLKHMHLIGVDHLYPKIGTEAEPDQHVALKIASSAAHHFGSTRLLCESMGGTYWDCTLERMKWMMNWEYVLGVNLFNNHGYHYSIEGERKRDWPPSQFYHHTWWKYYDQFTTYAARLSHLLSGGRHVAKVLVLYPLSSIWTNYVPQKRNDIGNVIEFDFNYLTDTLLRLHYDYDYVDEDVLAEATVRNGTITIRDETYSVLILPPITHIKESAFSVIRKFVQSGGKVIADTLLPIEFLETEKNGAAKQVRNLFGVDPLSLLKEFQKGEKAKFSILHRNTKGEAFVIRGRGLYAEKKKKELRQILNKCVAPDVTISDEEVFYLHRVKDDFDIYFLVNTSQQEKRNVEITFEQLAQPELWNTTTGEIKPIHVLNVRNGRLAIRLDFAASESHVVVLKGKLQKPYLTESNLEEIDFDGKTIIGSSNDLAITVRAVTEKGPQTIRVKGRKPLPTLRTTKKMAFRLEGDNALLLTSWRMNANGRDGDDFSAMDYDDSTWLPVTNGAWEMQFPQERSASTYPVMLWYRTSFEVGSLPPNTRLLIDGFSGSSWKLFVNGQEVRDKGKRSRLDAEIKEVDIQPFLRRGRNVIAVQLVATRRTDGILDPLKIIGHFSLHKKRKQYVIEKFKRTIRVGDWTKQGFPFFSGTGVYATEFYLPSTYDRGRLMLELECGEDVAEVSVNGNSRYVLPWHPYRLDITPWVRSGSNTLEVKVTNTLINLLEGVQKASGLMEAPQIIHQHIYTVAVDESRQKDPGKKS
jgi:hypothetical protein